MPNDIKKLRRLMRTAHALRQAQPKDPWSNHVAKAWLFERLRTAMQKDVICFAYVKNDGSTREARGTLCNKYIPVRAQPKGVYEALYDEDTALRFNYYDIDAAWWRSFYIDAFIDTLDNDGKFNNPGTSSRQTGGVASAEKG